MCMASVMCMLLLLIPLPVSANDLGSILLKAAVEDEGAVYNLSNTEFTMYQVGIYKKNSWVLETEFAKSGAVSYTHLDVYKRQRLALPMNLQTV